MKRALIVTIVLAVLLVFALSALAAAAPGEKANQAGLKGADQVYLGATGTMYDNPGKMFQAIRAYDGSNPHEWVVTPHAWGDKVTVGAFIYQRAGAVANH